MSEYVEGAFMQKISLQPQNNYDSKINVTQTKNRTTTTIYIHLT